MSAEMAVNAYDIVSTFQAMGMMKYWKGKHIILKRQVGLQSCAYEAFDFLHSYLINRKLVLDFHGIEYFVCRDFIYQHTWLASSIMGTCLKQGSHSHTVKN